MKPVFAKNNNGNYWLTAFLLFPLLGAMRFGDAYTVDKGMKLLYSALAGGLAGLIGFAGYYFTNNASTITRVVTLVSLTILTALPTFLLPAVTITANSSGVNHTTCPVCGYVAYKDSEQACENCGEELTQAELHQSGLSTLDSLVLLDQAFYFIPDAENAPVSFEQPAISEDGYKLDTSWHPSVSKADVEAQAIQYYRFKKRNPVKVRVTRVN